MMNLVWGILALIVFVVIGDFIHKYQDHKKADKRAKQKLDAAKERLKRRNPFSTALKTYEEYQLAVMKIDEFEGDLKTLGIKRIEEFEARLELLKFFNQIDKK